MRTVRCETGFSPKDSYAFVLLSLLREEGAKKSLPETLSGQNFAARANGATVNSGDFENGCISHTLHVTNITVFDRVWEWAWRLLIRPL